MATPSRRPRRSSSKKSSPRLPLLLGVIHLPPLPGAPGAAEMSPTDALGFAGHTALQQALTLQKAGFHALILENFGDTPFYKDSVPPETIASMAVLAAAIREAVPGLPIGINVLRNDASAALAIATVTGCDFIRVNVLSGVAATDQGIIEGNAAEWVRERIRLNSPVQIFADVHVKHARTLSSEDIGIAIEEVAHRGGADAVIVTGQTTGRPIDFETLQKAHEACGKQNVPLYLGSGTTSERLEELSPWVSGFIVGSDLRSGGKAGAPLEAQRIKRFMKAYQALGRPEKKTKASTTRKKTKRNGVRKART